jgi:hypothetical protein
MRKVTKADLPAIYPIFFTVFPREGKETIAEGASIDTAIADLFGIPEKPFSESIAACYDLLDDLVESENDKYTNVEFREYRQTDGQFSHIICDINDDTDYTNIHGSGTDYSRASAMFKAIVAAIAGLAEGMAED